MTETRIELVLAVSAAVVALIGAIISANVARRTVSLQHQMEREHRRLERQETVQEVMSRYREPLLRAAFDLQSRIYNIVQLGFLQTYYARGDETERDYALHNTLFVFAEYLGWVEILRRGVQFLDLGDVERNQQLVRRLDAIGSLLLSSPSDAGFRIFRGQQRAIGEIMVDPAPGNGGRQCLGYAAFVDRLEHDAGFARWFTQLSADVQALAGTGDAGRDRLVALQHALLDLIEFLDDPPVRFPDPATRGRL